MSEYQGSNWMTHTVKLVLVLHQEEGVIIQIAKEFDVWFDSAWNTLVAQARQ